MASVAHPLPSRTAQNIAALYGHEDETLVAWQRFCAQAAETLRTQHDSERLTKALALAQGGHVEGVLPTSLRELRFSRAYSLPYRRNSQTGRPYDHRHTVTC